MRKLFKLFFIYARKLMEATQHEISTNFILSLSNEFSENIDKVYYRNLDHWLQVTENAVKKLDTAGLFMFIYCGPVTWTCNGSAAECKEIN